MTDKIYEKQLEQFGIEATVIERQRAPVAVKVETSPTLSVVKDLMNTVQGRQWIWEKLATCQTFGFICDPERVHHVSYLRGQQDVGLLLYQEINAIAPDMILAMNQEAAQRSLIGSKRQPDPEEA